MSEPIPVKVTDASVRECVMFGNLYLRDEDTKQIGTSLSVEISTAYDDWLAEHDRAVAEAAAKQALEAVANWIVDTPQVVRGMSTYVNTHQPETVLEWLRDEIQEHAASISTDNAGAGA